jgi:hypothetical protein
LQFKDASALEGWQREINKYGGNVGNDVKAYNEKWYGEDNTPQDDALMRSIKCSNSRAGSLVGRQRWLTKLLARDRRNRLPHDGRSARPRRRRRRGAHLWRRQVDTRGRRGVNQSMGTKQAFNQAYPAMTGRGLAPVDTASFADTLRRLGISQGINR